MAVENIGGKDYIRLADGKLLEYSLDNPIFADFERLPAPFEQFIRDPYYLGGSWKNPWPFWMEQGKKFYPLPMKSPYSSLVLLGATGIGKALPNYQGVLTPDGYKPIGELKVGDLVASNDGKFYPVLGVYPQGKQPVYEIEFGYGIKCRCSNEHIWTVSRSWGKQYHEETTEEILKLGYKRFNNSSKAYQYRVELPPVEPIEYPEKKLPIDPYLLGCLIGDGTLTNNDLCFSTMDDYLVDRLNGILNKDWGMSLRHQSEADYRIVLNSNSHVGKPGRRPLKDTLNALGLNTTSYYKHIPEEYFTASVSQRKNLLDALIDTDGYVGKGGHVEFCSSSEILANGVLRLAESLGNIAKKKADHNIYYTYKGERRKGAIAYIVSIYSNGVLGQLPRKVERQKLHRLRKRHRIYNIEYIGEEECTCIAVAAPNHLFLTEHCIPTHNTSAATNMIAAYFLHVVLCLRNPQEFFSLEEQKNIVFAFLNIVTKTIAYKNAWGMLHKALLKSPFFMEYGIKTEGRYPEWVCKGKPIELLYGSTADQIIGLDIIFCMTGDTEIKTPKGWERLEDLTNQLIQVETFNSKENKIELSDYCKVIPTKKTTELIEMELEDGSKIRCTPEHKFLLKSGEYKEAQYLTEEDELAEAII